MQTWRELYSLEATKPLKKTLESILGFIIVIIIGIVFLTFTNQSQPLQITPFWVYLIIGLFVLWFILRYTYEVFYMKYYFYDATPQTISIRKGVFSRNEITLPFKRLQDVYVDQDILDRIFGLYDVHVSSATTTSATLSHIDGLNKENAEKIKKILLRKIHGD